jgi:hypothetical protein
MTDGPFRFAWTGGLITELVTLVTTGTTHGGQARSFSMVGDVIAGVAQIRNLATTEGIEVGRLYTVTGPGLPDDAFFIYDTGPGNEPDNSVNLSSAATATVSSATFTVLQTIVIGNVPSQMTQGSNAVYFGPLPGLAPGIYGIEGTGIGQTPAPIRTSSGSTTITVSGSDPIMLVPSAWFEYTGDGNALMQTFVATPHDATSWDPTTGQPTTATTYSVAQQEVTATTSGTFPLVLTGVPDQDWYIIDGMAPDVLATLEPGLQYNISGPGIQPGTTFIAPAAGATSITLDQATESAQINCLVTITGPRVPNAPFDPAVHNRFDEEILGIEILQDEGGFATLTTEIKNPQIGLLALGRNLWCWLSWDQAWTPDGTATPDLVPLFNGRLVGIPRLQATEIVQLQFLARPDDYIGQKDALVAALAVLPYYDPVWLASNINPDTVLEAYSVLWHIDRTSLELTFSDVLRGEDGTITIAEDQAFYDSFSLSYGQPPLSQVEVSGTVSWQQQGDGFIDITSRIIDEFHAAGSPWGQVYPAGGGMISCLCGNGLKSDWPKPGTSIGGGWSLSTLNDANGVPQNYIIDAWKGYGGWYTPQYYNVVMAGMQAPTTSAGDTVDQSNVNTFFAPSTGMGQLSVGFPVNIYKVRMTLMYRADRKRTETVSAVLTANVQRVLSDPADADRDTIQLSSEYISQGVDPGGQIPIGDLRRRSYFQTDRGAASFVYMLLAARAKLRFRARAADITFGTDWRTALGISLRNSITYFDRRIPGGSATGKVKSYRLVAGSEGMYGEFTIGCSVGTGDPSVIAAGVNSYVEDEYVDDYQTIAGGQVTVFPDELGYQPLDSFVIDDDGLDLANLTVDTAMNEFVVTNGLLKQLQTLAFYQGSVMPTVGDPLSAMTTLETRCTLDMKPVAGGEFSTSFFPAVTALALPMAIDLSAGTEE